MTTKSARSLFLDAVELPPERWSEYLDEVCEGDLALHQKIVRLLAAHQQVTGFMNQPAVEGSATVEASREKIGAKIGPYELKEQIGEGGMGIVYVAEQKEPIRRFVALKVIKPGMDTKQVVARFEAERQTLAILDHPHIARVIDAGTTEQGRPFFVMELVRGVPITEFCDAERLPICERLKLFCQVCEAVQHAHQKGIIHRDLKPSNVLVMRTDDQPIPKVIDFGIAKAVNQPLTEKSIYSQFGHVMGTPLYMSPEQAQLTGLDIDTRSDVYSLGVLLYELLTGTTPFASEVLRDKGLDEFRRLVREEEPAHPSHRISTLNAEAGSTISAKRGVDPRRLRQLMRGELDWIALRCLEKERNRRYQSASDLAADVQRYLDDKAVEASPPSSWYRFRKFAKRNRGSLMAATVALAALLAAAGVSLWQARAANQARVLADQSAADSRSVLEFFENRVLAAARPEGEDGGLGIDTTIRDAIEAAEREIATEFSDRPLVEASLRHTIGRTYSYLSEPDRAIEQFERSRELYAQMLGPNHPDTLDQEAFLADALVDADRTDEARTLYEATLVSMQKHLGPDDRRTIDVESSLAMINLRTRKAKDGTRILEELRERTEKLFGPDDDDTLAAIHNLAWAYSLMGKYERSIPLLEIEFSKTKAKHGETSISALMTASTLAHDYLQARRYAEAESLYKQTLQLAEAKLGPEHRTTLHLVNGLGYHYLGRDRYELAIPLLERCLAGMRKNQGDNHSVTIAFMDNLANAYRASGKPERALPFLQDAHASLKAQYGFDHEYTRNALLLLTQFYLEAGKFEQGQALVRERVAAGTIDRMDVSLCLATLDYFFKEADRVNDLEPVRREVFEAARKEYGWEHRYTQAHMKNLIACYDGLKQPEKVEALWRELIAKWEKHFPNHVDHARALYNLAYHLLNHSRVDEAKVLAERAWEMVRTTQPDDWRTFETESLLGACLLAKRDYDGARPHLLAGYRGLRDYKNLSDKSRLLEPLDRIAQFCEETGQWEDAVRNRYYANEMRRQWKMPLAEPETKR